MKMKTLTISAETWEILSAAKKRTGMPLYLIMQLALVEWHNKHIPKGSGIKVIIKEEENVFNQKKHAST